VQLIEKIAKAGIKHIEVGSMVHPDKVPNMADSASVFKQVSHLRSDCELGMLVPNGIGVNRAYEVGVEKYNIFFSPSEYFNVNNFGRNLSQIFTEYCNALNGIHEDNIRVYISTAFGCPMVGDIPTKDMIKTLEWANTLGNNIVLCDTIGTANPSLIRKVMKLTERKIDADISLHLHHGLRKGKMMDNLSAGFDMGVTQFDSSIGGMGGCPFVPGSGGNLATEHLVQWAEKENLDCGVTSSDLRNLVKYVDSTIKV
jgi:hydroxymethylglutaryl-CoA lyase